MTRNRNYPLVRWMLAAIVVALAGQDASLAAAEFRPLGGLPGGLTFSSASGVSADGNAVVGISVSADGFEAFVWTAGSGMVGLGDLPGGGFSSYASAASGDGSVVVGSSWSTDGFQAFRWTAATGIVPLDNFPGGSFQSNAYGVSADGSVVVGQAESDQGAVAVRWTLGGAPEALGDLSGGAVYSIAAAISADGSVIVGASESSLGTETFRYTDATGMVGLGDLPGGAVFSGANAVSASGSMIVGLEESELPGVAFRWDESHGMVGLGFLETQGVYPASEAYDVSADGAVVVGSSGSELAGSRTAFLWHSTLGMMRVADVAAAHGVDLGLWQLTVASGVSDDGSVIVGEGINPGGQREAWRLDLASRTPGDSTGDRQVDRRDLASLVRQFSLAPSLAPASDFNGDFQVSLADLALLQSHLGASFAPSPVAAVVPEPSSFALALAAVLVFSATRRRSRATLKMDDAA